MGPRRARGHSIDTTTRSPIRTDATGHYFARDDGSPFFYLADTVWMLFCRLTEEEARELFADRAAKGFTAIQAVVFRDLFEPNTPNVHGVRPFASEQDMHAARLDPEWIDWVVHVVRVADEYGLVIGLLPTWGDKWNDHSNSAGPVIMDTASAREYCRRLSDALVACENVIWILGGDSPVQEPEHAATIHAMARGLREGGSGQRLITFHPSGMGSSAIFHGTDWLDFNSLQTSHYKPNVPGHLHIERLFAETPTKPCLDMEPNYELSPMFEALGAPSEQPWVPTFSAYDVRKSLYRTVLAGAAGFAYGCEPIRQVVRAGERVHNFEDVALPDWREALDAPGSAQLSLLPRLLSERSSATRVPAQELLLPPRQAGAWPDRMSIGVPAAGQQNTDPASYVSVARCTAGSWIMVYVPVRQLVEISTGGLAGDQMRVTVHDPESLAELHRFVTPRTASIRLVPERDLDTLFVIDAQRR